MSLPRSIQQQADEANKHFESLQNPAPAAPEPDEKQPDAPDTATQPDEPELNADDAKRSEDDKAAQEPQRSESYWEHRFNVINGKYAAEVPSLREEIRTLTKQLTEKDREIETLKQSSTQSTNPGGLTDEQLADFKDQFGEDFVSFVQRMVTSSNDKPDNGPEVQELKRKVEQFEQKDRQTVEASFWTALTELVPDWRTVNTHDKFHAFLAQYDPQTGKQRQQTLNAAQQALDADGVAGVFDAFKKQQPASQSRIPDDQVDPQTSRSTQAPQGQAVWTSAGIKQFYKDKAAGNYSADEGQRLEADIFAAQRDGRIR